MKGERLRREYHQARWDEPIIYEMSKEGVRGVLPPQPDEEIQSEIGDPLDDLPEEMRRDEAPDLPELSQKEVLMHYLHLSQETLGANLTEDMSQATSTMKYNPRINEELVASSEFASLHPRQPEDTVQGILKIYYEMGEILKELSGMDEVSFQAGGGSQAIHEGALMMRKYHKERGNFPEKDEIITTIFSHPSCAAAPEVAGFKVKTLYPGDDGLPKIEALKSAISENTAGLFITNPEDIGIYNDRIDEFVDLVHEAGGLCFYDMANANAFLGIARAREAGFDICHFNLHKTFGSPHGCGGPGNGAVCTTDEMSKYLPVPLVHKDEDRYYLDFDLPKSIGKVRDFYGTASVVLRAYAWSRAVGLEGMREVARVSNINNNYIYEKLAEIKGLDICYPDNDSRRMEQTRYSWEKLEEDTGVSTDDVQRRVADFGIQHYWKSHHPWVIPQPMSVEPCETYTKEDMDKYLELFEQISSEAYEDPELVKNAPYKTAGFNLDDPSALNDPERWALTWRAFLKKKDKIFGSEGGDKE